MRDGWPRSTGHLRWELGPTPRVRNPCAGTEHARQGARAVAAHQRRAGGPWLTHRCRRCGGRSRARPVDGHHRRGSLAVELPGRARESTAALPRHVLPQRDPLACARFRPARVHRRSDARPIPARLRHEALRAAAHRDPERVGIGQRKSHPLWDTFPVLLALCALLDTEWLLRRRWGFVLARPTRAWHCKHKTFSIATTSKDMGNRTCNWPRSAANSADLPRQII
jgi:hypothetical protein